MGGLTGNAVAQDIVNYKTVHNNTAKNWWQDKGTLRYRMLLAKSFLTHWYRPEEERLLLYRSMRHLVFQWLRRKSLQWPANYRQLAGILWPSQRQYAGTDELSCALPRSHCSSCGRENCASVRKAIRCLDRNMD